MIVENGIYTIKITKDETFTLNSTDNKPYNLILNPNDMKKRHDYYKTFSISIDNGNYEKQIALIGSFFGADDDVAILENNDLIVLMNTSLVVIDCRTLTMKMHKIISNFGIYFSIHRFDNGYIVYGELDILKLTSQFEIEWTFFGADIFVSSDGSVSFFIKNGIVFLSDWEGNKYQLNKFGQEISGCSN